MLIGKPVIIAVMAVSNGSEQLGTILFPLSKWHVGYPELEVEINHVLRPCTHQNGFAHCLLFFSGLLLVGIPNNDKLCK